MSLLEVKDIQKVYTSRFSNQQQEALKQVSFTVETGEFLTIMGESGSGKTTLLNILSTLDEATSGEVVLDGLPFSTIKDSEASSFRRNTLGFVFQDFHLLDNFSIKDNILLPLVLSNTTVKEMESRINPIAKKLGIQSLLEKFPYEASGGQQQRVAVARALITRPKMVLADEPTGALDSKASQNLLQIFEELNEEGQTIIMVTHSNQAASHSKRVLFIKDGIVYHEIYRGDQKPEEFSKRISNTLVSLNSRGESE